MKIAIVRERVEGETRVAATPETVQKLVGLGNEVFVETGAGASARFTGAVTGFPLATNGGDITVQWDNGAFKIFAL